MMSTYTQPAPRKQLPWGPLTQQRPSFVKRHRAGIVDGGIADVIVLIAGISSTSSCAHVPTSAGALLGTSPRSLLDGQAFSLGDGARRPVGPVL
jgi:hypothetical protein